MTVDEALDLARSHGVEVRLSTAGNGLHLEARAEPPPRLLAILGCGKWDIVAVLRQREAEERRRITQWVADNFTSSSAGFCALCGGGPRPDDPFVLLFVGSDRADVHSSCHSAWRAEKEAEARKALGAGARGSTSSDDCGADTATRRRKRREFAARGKAHHSFSDGRRRTMKYELHPACSAWPTMKPEGLRELADDITANGLRDPVTLTPDDLLLDGRNRALACEMAGVEPATTIFDGDPWLFSLSRNKHRRHMTVDQIAMVVANMATLPRGKPKHANPSNEGISAAVAAKAAGVPETAIDWRRSCSSTARLMRGRRSSPARPGQEDCRPDSRPQATSAEPDRYSKRPAAPLGKKRRSTAATRSTT